MTSETLNGIDNFTPNLAFNDQNINDLEDGNNMQNEIATILNDPVFISALNVANYETVNDNDDSTSNKNNEVVDDDDDDDENGGDNDVASEENDLETAEYNRESNSNLVYRPIEKLRIVIPPSMSSPTSMHSSSSECSSPVRSKKNKKRFCIKCNIRFKHTIDWLKHLEKHVSLPSIKLMQLDMNNEHYKNYLERCKSAAKRRLSSESENEHDHEHLKIKLKIPRTDNFDRIRSNERTEKPSEPINSEQATIPPVNGCRIRVLRAEEIKQSPPRTSSPIHMNLPGNAMVSLPSENRIHYECPPLDGLNQFAEDAMNEESTAQILKHLLETPNEPESSEWDSNPNEFISIDRLAHTCKTCNEKYPNLNFLQEHQRLTGHGERPFSSASILEPIQEMIVDPLQQYHPPQTSRLEHILGQPKNNLPPPPPRQQQPPSMYGQPPVLPIHQMENQVLNFPNMNQMPNRQRFPMPPRHPSQVPPSYPMHRYPQMLPQSQMIRPNGLQPINMTPFLNMSPDMYNPRQPTNNIPMNSNGMNAFNRGPGQMMNRFMPPPPPQQQHQQQQQQQQQPTDPNMMQRFPMPPQRSPMNGPLNARPIRNLPPCPIRPNMGNSPPIRPNMGNSPPIRPNMGNSPPIRPNMGNSPMMQRQPMSFTSMEQQHKSRYDLMMRVREIENRPFISNAPRTEGLPVIESVQSGAITLNSTKKSVGDAAPTTIQINDQITLSVKNKDSTVIKPIEKRTTPPITDSNTVANILEKRGITVKSTTKLVDKPKIIDDSNKTPYASADAAVQKLQMNNSVSIISKKKVITPPATPAATTTTTTTSAAVTATTAETIDLSNDDDTPVETFKKPEQVPSKLAPSILRCPLKSCAMKFSNVKTLREHEQKVHQVSRLSKFKCTICSLRFVSSDAVKAHIRKTHTGQTKTQPEFGIPIVNFNDPNIRKKMLSLGFTNFLPITNARDDKTELFGMPIININGPSVNNLKNLFDSDSTKIMPINAMRTIPRPKVPTSTSTKKPAPPPQPNRIVPKPSSNHPIATTNTTEMPSTFQK